jgi:hypothetical protein
MPKTAVLKDKQIRDQALDHALIDSGSLFPGTLSLRGGTCYELALFWSEGLRIR